jgi:DNA-binding transcriptional ArsR family regulator
MEIIDAIEQLSALAQENRLSVFRLLVKAGPDGLPAGEIARLLQVPPNTLSAQLSILANAGLVRSVRKGRSIVYAVDFKSMSALLLYLAEDCCQGHAEVCAPLSAIGQNANCCPPSSAKGAVA